MVVTTALEAHRPREFDNRKQGLSMLVEELRELPHVSVSLDEHNYPERLWVIMPEYSSAEVVGSVILLTMVIYKRLGLSTHVVDRHSSDGSLVHRFS